MINFLKMNVESNFDMPSTYDLMSFFEGEDYPVC